MKAIGCCYRAQSSVWRPGRVGGPDFVCNWRSWCAGTRTACLVERHNLSEPMIASVTDLRIWQQVGTGKFVYEKATDLLVVDYAAAA